MWESAVLWFAMAMVVYGIFSAVVHIIGLIQSLRGPAGGVAYLVLVRDQADRVEGVVRSLAQEVFSDLVLVDMGSTDDSPAILQRLARHYENAHYFRLGTGDRSRALTWAMSATGAPFVVLIDLDPDPSKKGKT